MAIDGFRIVQPSDYEPHLSNVRQWLGEGADLEAVWRQLRDSGLDWGETIYVTQWATGMPHRDAKLAVYRSDTWRDLRPAIDELHESIERAVVEMQAAGEIEVRFVDHATKSGAA